MPEKRPTIGAPKREVVFDGEFANRQAKFLEKARKTDKLQDYLVGEKIAVSEQMTETKSFLDVILRVLGDKQDLKEIIELDIKMIIFEQDDWSKNTLVPLAEGFFKATEQKTQTDILTEIFKRANTSAIKIVNEVLQLDHEPNEKSSANRLNLAAKYPVIYKVYKQRKQDIFLNIETYACHKLLKEFIKKIKQFEHTQASEKKQFNIALDLAAMTFTPGNKTDLPQRIMTESPQEGSKQQQSSFSIKAFFSFRSATKKGEESPYASSPKPIAPRKHSMYKAIPTTSSSGESSSVSPPKTTMERKRSLFKPASPKTVEDELNKAVRKRGKSMSEGNAGKKNHPY